MSLPTISCNVIDRRSGLPAPGVLVLLRCLNPRLPNCEFQARTDDQGYVFEWPGCNIPEFNLLHFLCTNNYLEKTSWQIGFLTTEYFHPIRADYTCADVNFELSQGQQPQHITVYADIKGYGIWIEPLKEFLQRPITSANREYQKLSKDQNKALIEHFVDEPYPNSTTYWRLSEDNNLSIQQTVQWFRRQRAQGRREQKRQKRSMLQDETTLEAGGPGTDHVTAVSAGTAVSELSEAGTVDIAALEARADAMKAAEIEYPGKETDVIGTVFVELGGKVFRRSVRQAEKAAK